MWPFRSVPTVSPAEAAQKVLAANVGFIDVRSPAEYKSGHATGATNYPLGELGSAQVEKLRPLTEVYVICQSGGRSATATSTLVAAGINAFSVAGGTSAWKSLGLPIS